MAYSKVMRRKSGRAVLKYAIGKDGKGHNEHERRNEVIGCVNLLPGVSIANQMQRYWNLASEQHKTQVIHVIQSFSKKEFDPDNPLDLEKANQVGVEMAKTYYPNRQVAVFTQIDGKSGCVHNHLVINDVEMETYKGCDKQQYHFPSVKRWTNEITQKYTVLDKGEKNPDKLTQTEKTKIENGEYSWKEDMRERIKKALSECETQNDFFGKLQSNGISVQHKTAKRDTAKHKEFYVYELKDLSNVPEGEKAPRNTKLRSYNLGNSYDVDGVKEYFDLKQSTRVMPAAEQVQAVQMVQDEQENEPEPKRKRKKHLRFKEYLKSQGYEFYLNENGDIYKFGEGLDYKTLVEEYDEYLMTPLEEDEEQKEEEVKKEVVEKMDSVKEQEPEVPEPEEPIPEENNVQEETVPVEQVTVQPDAEAERLREENRERAEKIALDKRKAESKLPGRIWGQNGQKKHRRLPGEPEYEDGGYDRSL